ncbi:MAG: DUF5615 family PIN-like protein [Pseudomonadota bacterium]
MRFLIDMNLSPGWVGRLAEEGIEAVHWSAVGRPDAPDSVLFNWARDQGYVVYTHDLDFGAMLATTGGTGPSVFQIRTQDVSPSVLGARAVALMLRFQPELEQGALIVVDEVRERVRILPLMG